MAWPPHVTVACIIEWDHKFLMVEEAIMGKLVINQPAGHLDPDETLVAAAHREVMEETGWEVRLTGLSGLYEYVAKDADILFHRVSFIAEPVRQISTELDPDIHQAVWMSLEEIESAALRSPMVLQSVRDYLAGQRADLAFLKHLTD